jgi:protein-disulfide isomerase
MNRSYRLLAAGSLLALTLTAAAQQPPASNSAPPKTTAATSSSGQLSEAMVNEFLKQMFGWNQQLSWKVAQIKPAEDPSLTEVVIVFSTPQGQQVAHLFVTPGQKFALSGDLVPFGTDPFAEDREKLKAASGPSHGPQDAPVTIVEFGDLECPACKAAQPNLTKLMEEEPKAKLVFQNFPLEQVHKWALLGAKYIDCIGRENNQAVWKFIPTVYEHQGEITDHTAAEALKGYAKDSGADPAAVAACIDKPETEKRVRDSIALGEKLSVTSTPTFYINGRKVANFVNTPYDVVKAMVDYAASSPGK